MSTTPQIDWSKYATPPAQAPPQGPQQIDWSKYETSPANTPQQQPGMLSKAWDAANTGLVSGDTIRSGLEKVVPGMAIHGDQDNSREALTQEIDANPSQWDVDHPVLGGIRRGLLGASRDTMDTLSSFTSPASIALMGAGAAGKAFPAAGKIATTMRGIQGAASAVYGAQGAKQTYDAVTDKSKSMPERVQQGLTGAAGMTGGAAGVMDAAPSVRSMRGYLSEKMAPAAVEGALRVRATDRAHLGDKLAIGRSVLDDLTANKPDEILQQANAKIAEYGDQLNDIADKSNAYVSMTPAYDALDDIEKTAKAQNSKQELKIVRKVRDQLTKRDDGSPIPSEPTAREALDLKRGIGKLKNWSSPQEAALAGPIVERVYGAMDGALDKALPGSQGVNQKLSALMRVADRAEDITNLASEEQKGFARFAAHTGVLAAPTTIGGTIGYALGGPAGAAIGTGVGASTIPFVQEAVASPKGQIRIARLMNRAGNPPPASTAKPLVPPTVRRLAPGSISSAMASQRKNSQR
jgi:hypothetical protein